MLPTKSLAGAADAIRSIEATRVHHAARRRGGVAACGAWTRARAHLSSRRLFASPRDAPHYVALFDELRRLGFIEGRNLVLDAAGFGLPPERMDVHAADLMSGPVDVIVATGDAAVRA